MDFNRAQLIGNLTSTPELQKTKREQSVTSFSVATNYSYKSGNGETVTKPEFHNIQAWGKLAEIITKYGFKGQKVMIEGRLETQKWENPEGVKMQKTQIIADNFIMLSKGEKSPSQPEDLADDEVSIEDVPF